MACRMSLTALSVFMTVFSIILSAMGTFLQEWWIDRDQRTYGLLTVVQCRDYFCQVGEGKSDGWVMFVRVMAYAEFIMLLFALATTCIGRLCHVTWITFVAMASLAIACLFTLVNTFTLVTIYPKLTAAFREALHFPDRYVYYQTLPLGMVAISGTFCVPAFISLAIRQTKAKKGVDTKPSAAIV